MTVSSESKPNHRRASRKFKLPTTGLLTFFLQWREVVDDSPIVLVNRPNVSASLACVSSPRPRLVGEMRQSWSRIAHGARMDRFSDGQITVGLESTLVLSDCGRMPIMREP